MCDIEVVKTSIETGEMSIEELNSLFSVIMKIKKENKESYHNNNVKLISEFKNVNDNKNKQECIIKWLIEEHEEHNKLQNQLSECLRAIHEEMKRKDFETDSINNSASSSSDDSDDSDDDNDTETSTDLKCSDIQLLDTYSDEEV